MVPNPRFTGWIEADGGLRDLAFVPRTPHIPRELRTRPFSLDEARALGLSSRSLKGRHWRRLGASLYCWAGLAPDTQGLIAAWRRMLPPDATFVGRTAAWLHGLYLDLAVPVEVAVPLRHELRSREGLSMWRSDIADSEITAARGVRVTTVPRTLLDLCARLPSVEALIALDTAVRKHMRWQPAGFKGRPGAARLRRLTELAAPAESPMETRLRWLLISAGLPTPQVQVELRDVAADFAPRADLFYPEARLVIEFDGGNHRDRLVSDDRRQNLIIAAGYRLLRFTSPDLFQRSDLVIAQVRGALVTPALFGPG